MTPIQLLILLAKCDDKATVLLETLHVNQAQKVVQVKFRDQLGLRTYVYVCDNSENLIDCYKQSQEDKFITDLEIKEIK